MLKVGGVGFVCESCSMLGFVHNKKSTSRFSQVMGVYSVFVGFVSQLCSFYLNCVWSVDTRGYTQSSLPIFTTLGTAVLSSLYSGVGVHL